MSTRSEICIVDKNGKWYYRVSTDRFNKEKLV